MAFDLEAAKDVSWDCRNECEGNTCDKGCCDLLPAAIAEIERLLAENERLERGLSREILGRQNRDVRIANPLT